ncbi:MAG: hypothetical protein ACREDP_16630, partial [Bradyrhizobium sp.]
MIGARFHRLFRKLRKDMAGEPGFAGTPFSRLGESFARARVIVKFFYLCSAYISYLALDELHRVAAQAEAWDFLWPVQWLANLPAKPIVDWLALACFLASLLAFQFEERRSFRALFAVAFLLVAAIVNSFGGTNHLYHAWLWIAIGLIFLPQGSAHQPSRLFKMSYLTTIAAYQALLLSFYSLAGIWKTLNGVAALVSGHVGNFSPGGLSATLADRMLQTGTSPLLADYVIDHVWLAWPMFLVLIYVQLFAVFVAFRPQLHVLWGYALIGFHLGTWLLMEIVFPQHVLFLALFFLLSPFRPARWTLRGILVSLPLFGPALRYV